MGDCLIGLENFRGRLFRHLALGQTNVAFGPYSTLLAQIYRVGPEGVTRPPAMRNHMHKILSLVDLSLRI